MKYAEVGTISWATMREEDLIPIFAQQLLKLAKTQTPKMIDHIREANKILSRVAVKEGYYGTEESSTDLNETLFDALNYYAPVGCYFGAHPADGSDYGFWPSEDFDREVDLIVPEKLNHVFDKDPKFTGLVLVNSVHRTTLYYLYQGVPLKLWEI